jgi:hypothetical protein
MLEIAKKAQRAWSIQAKVVTSPGNIVFSTAIGFPNRVQAVLSFFKTVGHSGDPLERAIDCFFSK